MSELGNRPPAPPDALPRRDFIKNTTVVGVAGALAFPHISRAENLEKNKVLKVGLVGCGARGSGAVTQALSADPHVKLWALGDVFQKQIDKTIQNLTHKYSGKMEVEKSRQFTGLDAYQKVIDSGVDVVLLAGPPGFRPLHLAAAVRAGKHVFAEKPIAVDMAGVKSIIRSARLAESTGVSIQHGFCWRFAPAVRAAYEKVIEGELGRVISVYGNYLASPPKPMIDDRARPAGMSDVEWQVRNWMGYEWLSGGPLIEQAIHAVDKMAWAMGDIAPKAAVATGGRAQKKDSGNTFDHYHVAYEYPEGVICHILQRQLKRCHTEVIDRVFCERGRMVGPGRPMIYDPQGKVIWRHRGRKENMYQVCHNELFEAIRTGKLISSGEYMANSTALALMGREAAHTGKRITWEDFMKSDQDLAPDNLKWNDAHEIPPVPVPGSPV